MHWKWQPFCFGLNVLFQTNIVWGRSVTRWFLLLLESRSSHTDNSSWGGVSFVSLKTGVGVTPGGGSPYVMGDTYVPRFWPPFFTLAGSSTIFLGYFFSSTNTKTIFCGIKTTNSYRIRSFRPQISFFPRSFWVQFSAASGTPPSFFGPSTPPGGLL